MLTQISDAHSSLYHYTSWEGLKGIVESNTLFATHAKFLNDSSELYSAASLLIGLLKPSVQKLVEEFSKVPEVNKAIKRDGSIEHHCDAIVQEIVSHFYKTTGTDFYICSFFGTPADPYTRKNGLLSQWRGYGKQQGFAIEFDTLKLEQHYHNESKSYDYTFTSFGDVVYGEDHPKFTEDFLPHFEALKIYVLNNLKKELGELVDIDEYSGFVPFCYCISMLKHVGFREEQEVRIAVSPLADRDDFIKTLTRLTKKDFKPKPVYSRVRNSAPIPFVKLFDFKHGGLPIKRVIVGPSKDKVDVAFAARKLLGSKFPIEICDTPFI